ncbi:hypothetical protein, partial [Arthrobacter sp. RIT-PI-e]|uniref:hypothetical protein n=1 Tax=Arthrobacter sp. RIT-PI-e TaxID=1681197 RepID=UPI001F1FD8CE
KIRNQPKKPAHHTGCDRPANSTNQQTIGINKLGTLLSSQTTGTNDYSRTPTPQYHYQEAIQQAGPLSPPLQSQLIPLPFPLSNPPFRPMA